MKAKLYIAQVAAKVKNQYKNWWICVSASKKVEARKRIEQMLEKGKVANKKLKDGIIVNLEEAQNEEVDVVQVQEIVE